MSKKNPMPKARQAMLIGEVEKRRQEMLDRVRAVAQGYTTALFVFGPGGMGKTHHITTELDGLCGQGWIHHTAYTTPKALFLALHAAPAAIHVFEDCESMYKVDVASSILRAACGAPRGGLRRITYQTAAEDLTCVFTGGIIIVSNESLARKGSGPLNAVASRFRPLKWELTREEIMATILTMAANASDDRGLHLKIADRMDVAKWMIDSMADDATLRVDLRTFAEHALPLYAQAVNGDSVTDWKQMLLTTLRGGEQAGETREQREQKWQDLALYLADNASYAGTDDRIKEWARLADMGQAQYYRYLRQARAKRHVVVLPKQ